MIVMLAIFWDLIGRFIYFMFGKILNLIWEIIHAIFIHVSDQILNK